MKMKNFLFLLLSGLLSLTNAQAQQDSNFERCSTMEADAQLRAKHPELGTHADFEQWMAKKLLEAQMEKSSGSTVITIPIIFHVIHNGEDVGTNSNITHAQVLSQIDVLNEDFRKMMGTPGFNTHPAGADVEIEFCAALYDPMGNVLPEPGVNRVDRNAKGFSSPPYGNTSYIDNTIKPNTIWNTDDYCNYWCLDLGGGLLGYAQFPTGSGLPGIFGGGAANTDGVVIGHRYTGRPPHNPFPGPYNLGRTATHEVGHWLGLRHIWGDGGCGQDDFCSDTPESDASNFGCPTNHSSCGTTDMIENYMDYTNDACMNIFTNDQKARMLVVMANSPRRQSLQTSGACTPLAAPSAGFIVQQSSICEGEPAVFSDTSANFPNAWQWTFTSATDTLIDSSKNPVIVFDSTGVYSVELIVSNSVGADTVFVQNVVTIVSAMNFTVNGIQADSSDCPGSCTGQVQVSITGGQKPYIFSLNGGQTFTNDSLFTGLCQGIYTIFVMDANGCTLDSGQIVVEALPEPVIGQIQNSGITCFGDSATLVVNATSGLPPYQYSINGGGLSTDSVFSGVSVGFQLIEVVDANGCSVDQTVNVIGPGPINSNIFSVKCDGGNGSGQFGFSVSGGTGQKTATLDGNPVTSPVQGLVAGNYLFRAVDANGCEDTTTVTIPSCIGLEDVNLASQVELYPNPASNQINLKWEANLLEIQEIQMVNTMGQIVIAKRIEQNSGSLNLEIDHLPTGTYFLQFSTETGVGIKRIVVQ